MSGTWILSSRAMDAMLARLAQELLLLLAWAAAAALCIAVACLACSGIYAASLRRWRRPRRVPEPIWALEVDEDVLGREVAQGISALEAWLAHGAPRGGGTGNTRDGKG